MLTHTDVLFAINKLTEFAHHPGEPHFEAILHLLHYLQGNNFWGLKFHSDYSTSSLYFILHNNNLPTTTSFITLCDSSWNVDDNTGHNTGNTGCFLIFYMGGTIDHSSNLLDPINLSSAEA